MSSGGLTVPGIARVIGQSRQAVQRITDAMVEDGLLLYATNPNHKKSMLVHLTDEGKRCYNLLREEQDPWAIEATEDISLDDLESSLFVVRRLIKEFDKK